MRRRTFLSSALAAMAVALSSASAVLGAAVAQVSSVVPRPRRIILPPVPKWKRATDDIDTNDYAVLCHDYERALLPRDIRFPRPGQVWEATHDCEVPFQLWP